MICLTSIMPTAGGDVESIFPGNLRDSHGKFRSIRNLMMGSFRKETIMNRPPTSLIPPGFPDPIARLEAMIAAARADARAADNEVAMAEAELEAIEPHPHAHGYTAGEDCRYAGFRPEHRLALAGLLARPWRYALAKLATTQLDHGLDYLLKAFPPGLDADGDALAEEGAAALIQRGSSAEDRFGQKPFLAIGMIWHIFGFHHRDRIAWVGAFAYRGGLHELVFATAGITRDTTLGDALTATVRAQSAFLSPIGKRELHDRAERRDLKRQASWESLDETYREHGPWRGWAPTMKQRRLMQGIEAARGLPMIDAGRRGSTADWITNAGGNPRFDTKNGKDAR